MNRPVKMIKDQNSDLAKEPSNESVHSSSEHRSEAGDVPEGAELLGKNVDYPAIYNPSLLHGIPRQPLRESLGLVDSETLPFHGVDFWNAYEFSWITPGGKPAVAMLELVIPSNTPNLIESKSLKLYLGSFNMTTFKDNLDVIRTIESDLSVAARAPVVAQLIPLRQRDRSLTFDIKGSLLDDLTIKTKQYDCDQTLLALKEPSKGMADEVKETLISHLFRSLCPVTGQPDWATVVIRYRGAPIDHESMLKYLLSYRNHSGFHEHCVEKIYLEVMACCSPKELSVTAHYTRRGGIEINPFRSNFEGTEGRNIRTPRQ